ncbi:hypothetical protein [Paenibacillus amylolyticus]|uniref:hypothetical protein n=1 Tax=Paenibacillus amylolyticus TaxID=1451 RepID=UPI000B875501|nr:hypothetical protein [Paenibacillus amylolyticus]
MKQIKVRCIDSFEEFNIDNGRLICAVNVGEELVADLHEESEEYYAMDSEGREVCVGYLNSLGTLKLFEDSFELVEEGADTE